MLFCFISTWRAMQLYCSEFLMLLLHSLPYRWQTLIKKYLGWMQNECNRPSESCHCIQLSIPHKSRVLQMLKTSSNLSAKQISAKKHNQLPGMISWVCFYHNQQMEILRPQVMLRRLGNGVVHTPAIHQPSRRWRFSVLFHHLHPLLQKAGNSVNILLPDEHICNKPEVGTWR